MSDVMPHSLEAERALLGGLLIQPERIFEIGDLIRPEDFYRQGHGELFAAMVECAEQGIAIDFITLRERLKAIGKLDSVGGPAYIAGLSDGVPRSVNLAGYAEILRAHTQRRRLILAAQKMAALSRDLEQEPRALIDQAEQLVLQVAAAHDAGDFLDAQQLVSECFPKLQQLAEDKAGVTGVPTGFTDLDDLTRGLQPSHLVILAARPSMGKTAFALQVAHHAATTGHTVGFFSLEMSREELFMRLVASVARIDGHRLQSGYLHQTDYGRMSVAIEQIAASNLHIDDTPVVTLMDIRSKARRLKAQKGLSLLLVDYLQLVELPNAENRNLAIAAVTRGLKLLAKELRIPIVLLSQLSRECERRADKRPLLSDLRDSGAIEQDADAVLFLFRPEVYDANPANAGIAEVIIAKQRMGPIATVTLHWAKESTRFDNASGRAA